MDKVSVTLTKVGNLLLKPQSQGTRKPGILDWTPKTYKYLLGFSID